MIVLHRLVAYSNHELSLENKIWKRIPYELMVQGGLVSSKLIVICIMWY